MCLIGNTVHRSTHRFTNDAVNVYIYIYIYVYVLAPSGSPLPHPRVMVHLVMPPPPVGCGVDRGGAQRIHSGRAHSWSCPPCGMWGGGAHGMRHAYMRACHACICRCMHALQAYAYMHTPCTYMHAGHAYATRWGSPSPGPYHGGWGGGHGTWDPGHIYIYIRMY